MRMSFLVSDRRLFIEPSAAACRIPALASLGVITVEKQLNRLSG